MHNNSSLYLLKLKITAVISSDEHVMYSHGMFYDAKVHIVDRMALTGSHDPAALHIWQWRSREM